MIKINDFCQSFNEETKINLKNLEFKKGKSYAILGVSGCGKTTLLNAIAGIRKPNKGSIVINNIDITKLSEKEKDKFRLENIGYIFQDFKLIEEMTVLDNLELLKIGKIKCENIDDILNEVGLLDKKREKIKNLSGGEKQRVAIARALLKNPQIILADEPTGSLNYENGRKIMELLKRCHEKNKQVMIFVTHDDRMAEFADEIINFEEILLKGGK